MKPNLQEKGFTLIELMITVMMIAIIAAIAIPSYHQYVIKNAEAQAQAKMKQLELELSSWRANTLSYKGFLPKKVNSSSGNVEYVYDDDSSGNAGKEVHIKNSNGQIRYKIIIDDGFGNSLAPPQRDLSNATGLVAGNQWRMYAEPTDSSIAGKANKFIMNSRGERCKSTNSGFAIGSSCAGTGVESW